MPPSTAEAATSPGEDASPRWHTLAPGEVTERLEVDPAQGLDEAEVARRREHHGPNELVHEEGPGVWTLVLEQFTEPLVVVLLAAAALSAAVWWLEPAPAEAVPWDAVVILAIVLLNALIGFVQEYRAERAVKALKTMAAPEARVRRGGELREVEAAALVPGDILVLEDGARVPADARILESASLKVEEAALTGESEPVAKGVQALEDPELAVGDRRNMVFMTSAITYGHGEAVVVATGMETEVGGIAGLLEASDDEETPLQRELDRVGRQLGWLVLAISTVVAVAGVAQAGELNLDVTLRMFLFGVALAVAAVPEGLPAVVTATLALGMRRLADRNAVVRSLPAVEALGSATVICTDKTGTLTRNQMTVRRLLLGDGTVVAVEGEGYAPEGEFRRVDPGRGEAETDGGGVGLETKMDPADAPLLHRLLLLGALDNDAALHEETPGEDPGGDAPRWSIRGDPTEGALVVAAEKAGIRVKSAREEHPRQGEIPFSSDRRRMTTVHDLEGEPTAVVKGAPEVIVERCTRLRRDGEVAELDDAGRADLLEANERFASRALRTLAVASRRLENAGAASDPDPEHAESELVFEGLVGMLDPPRSEAGAAVARAREAGVRTLMVTGDHVATARAIAREIGIGQGDGGGDGEGPEVLSGREVGELDETELDRVVARCSVYGRVDPAAKYRIVEALQRRGEIVAMTGDGVNDAPAVKNADIGVAMGRTGSDVTREAGDIVLADDDYATIVAAIEEGRTIFSNLKSFVRYLLSANAGEVLTILGAVVAAGLLGLEGDEAGFLLPVLAVQILWVNLVTDGPPALALGVSPAEPGVMRRPPRDPGAPVIDGPMWTLIAVSGLTIMVGTLAVLDAYLPGGMLRVLDPGTASKAGLEEALPLARTMAFTTLVMYQMVHVFNCLSQERSLFAGGLLRNRWLLAAVGGSLLLHAAVIYTPLLQRAFHTVALSPLDWGVAAGTSLSLVAVVEVLKRTPFLRRSRSKPG